MSGALADSDPSLYQRCASGRKLTVLVASPRGFCAGVRMALEALDHAIRLYGTPLFAYHDIVHNNAIIAEYRARGVHFVQDLAEAPCGAVVLISAHGASPAVGERARERSIRLVDATCPLVEKVHREARRYWSQGYGVILIGHRTHDETVGTMGECPDRIYLVETEDEAERLEIPPLRGLAFLTQTTLSIDQARNIADVLLRRFPGIESPSKADICYATQNRQDAVKAIAPETDLVIVVGSPGSSNSQALREVAETMGKPAYLVDRAEEMREEWFAGVQRLLVTSGASVSEVLLQSVIQALSLRFDIEVTERSIRSEIIHFDALQRCFTTA